MTVSESCPTIHLGGLSYVFAQRVVQMEFYQKIINVFSRTKTFCFENNFSHTWHKHA